MRKFSKLFAVYLLCSSLMIDPILVSAESAVVPETNTDQNFNEDNAEQSIEAAEDNSSDSSDEDNKSDTEFELNLENDSELVSEEDEQELESNNNSDAQKEILDQSQEETEQNSLGQDPAAENSWRYSEGNLKDIPELYSYGYEHAWEKVNGKYVNDQGEIIPGAVKKGVDVSEHNGKIDWQKVKNDGIDFAIIRCGYGQDQENQDDDYWEYNVSECERLGIPYGVYLYSYADTLTKASSEARHVLRLLEEHNPAYPIYYDLEDNITYNLSNSMKAQIATTFCNAISNAGYEVGVYSNLDWWTNYLTDPVFDSWSKWVAQWNSKCTYTGTYDVWQCSSSGQVDGISTNVDLNFWLEDDIDLDYVANIKASVEDSGSITIKWSPVSNADGYIIYRQVGNNGKFSYRYMVTGTTYTDITAQNYTYNFYRIYPYAYNSRGERIVGHSNQYVYAKPTLSAVQNLKAKENGTQIQLNWSSVKDADGYIIYRKEGDQAFKYCYMVNTTNYTDANAPIGQYNFYRIYPYEYIDGVRKIGPSTSYVYGKPSLRAVTNLKASGQSNAVKLSWTASSRATGYFIYRQQGSDGKFQYIGYTNGVSYTDKSAVKNMYNFYRVYPYYKPTKDSDRILGPSNTYVYAKAK